MERAINGKLIKITKAGYLYINGIRQSPLIVAPLHIPTSDKDALTVCREYIKKYYVMCNPDNSGF
jgi:hypothetical protein